ncbi:MAG: recombination mediator RecR [Pseudomonadota bacterium]
MSGQNADIETLIALMAKLPGLGPRSARRAVLQLIKKRNQVLIPLADAMYRVGQSAKECLICGNIETTDICSICADQKRATGEICVVEDVSDLWAIERGGAFKGRYHVLGGTLSALDGIGPEDLRIPQLIERLSHESTREVILALNATVDGQTTAHYIADQVEALGVNVTSLAQGVPIGGELDYLDDGTISAAIRARKSV